MKLVELFEAEQRSSSPLGDFAITNASYDKTNKYMQARANRAGSKAPLLGAGSYGAVYDQPGKDVSHVLKIGHQRDDPYDAYLSWIEKILNKHNPYFPQINEVQRLASRNGGEFFKVRMEKLRPLSELTIQEATFIANKWYGHEEGLYSIGQLLATRVKLQPDHMIAAALDRLFDFPNLRSTIQDQQLLEALNILDGLYEEGFQNDIKYDNIMLRRTKYGAQPVITDPLYMESARGF